MARIDTLGNFLTDVADAIRTAEGSSETIQASDFDTRIEALSSGGGVDLSDYLNIENVTKIISSDYWWTHYFTLEAFQNVTVTISTNVSGIVDMFYNCKWEYIPKIATQKNYPYTFNMLRAFSGCTNVKSLDLSGIQATITSTSYFEHTFSYCTSLTHIDIRNLTFAITSTPSNTFLRVPTDCEIIVKDATQKTWFNTYFPSMTNVKTVAEYEAE